MAAGGGQVDRDHAGKSDAAGEDERGAELRCADACVVSDWAALVCGRVCGREQLAELHVDLGGLLDSLHVPVSAIDGDGADGTVPDGRSEAFYGAVEAGVSD